MSVNLGLHYLMSKWRGMTLNVVDLGCVCSFCTLNGGIKVVYVKFTLFNVQNEHKLADINLGLRYLMCKNDFHIST